MDPKTLKQLSRFVITGLIATVADFGTYFALLETVLPGQNDIAKGISFLIGTSVAFILNKFWTFEAADGGAEQVKRFLVLYGISFMLNVGVNRGALYPGPSLLEVLHITAVVNDMFGMTAQRTVETFAVVCATGCSMVANFVGQKLWVFAEAPS